MLSIGQFEKNPGSIVEYYKQAIQNPKQFCQSINFDEELADSGLVILILVALQAVLNAALGTFGSILWGFLGTFLGFAIGALVGSVIIYVIGKIAGAKMNFQQSLNFVIHSWLLTFPLSLLSVLTPLVFTVTLVIQLVFLFYVLVAVFSASAKRVYVAIAILAFLILVPYACMMMSKAYLSQLEKDPHMQQVLKGRSFEELAKDMNQEGGQLNQAVKQMQKMQEGMEKSKDALPPCFDKLIEESGQQNPIFGLIGVQVQFLGMAPPDQRKKAIEKLNEQINDSINGESQAFPMSDEQKACLKEIQGNLSQLQ